MAYIYFSLYFMSIRMKLNEYQLLTIILSVYEIWKLDSSDQLLIPSYLIAVIIFY